MEVELVSNSRISLHGDTLISAFLKMIKGFRVDTYHTFFSLVLERKDLKDLRREYLFVYRKEASITLEFN